MTDKNKQNIGDLLAYAMKSTQAANMEEATREMAHSVKAMYDAFRAEGFTKADAMYFVNNIIVTSIMGLNK